MEQTDHSEKLSAQIEKYWNIFGAKSVGAYLRATAKIRTMAYTHLWDTRRGRNTHFLLNNFISTLSPGYVSDLEYSIELYDHQGHFICKSSSKIPAFAGESISVREISPPKAHDAYGMAVISIRQSNGFRRQIGFKNAYVIGSYFFAAWEDSSGHISCSHAIEGFKGYYYNVPRILSWMNPVEKWSPGGIHRSNKAISTAGLESMEIFVNNPSLDHRKTRVKIGGGQPFVPAVEMEIDLSSRGTKLVTLQDPSLWAQHPHLQIEFHDLPTGNAKPYCFLKYKGNKEFVGFHT